MKKKLEKAVGFLSYFFGLFFFLFILLMLLPINIVGVKHLRAFIMNNSSVYIIILAFIGALYFILQAICRSVKNNHKKDIAERLLYKIDREKDKYDNLDRKILNLEYRIEHEKDISETAFRGHEVKLDAKKEIFQSLSENNAKSTVTINKRLLRLARQTKVANLEGVEDIWDEYIESLKYL